MQTQQSATSKRFQKLIDEAQEASNVPHKRMRHELSIFKNISPYSTDYGDYSNVGNFTALGDQSLNPEIQKAIIRLIPAFLEQAARIEVLPDRSEASASSEEMEQVKDLDAWAEMYEDVDGEGERLETSIYHNLVFGHAVTKAIWDPLYSVVRLISVNPLSIAVDTGTTQSNLQNCNYLVHTTTQNERYVRSRYPTYDIPKNMPAPVHEWQLQEFTICEIWMHKWLAKEMGVNVKGLNREIVLVTMIDGHFVQARSMYWYPDLPYATWRNFPVFDYQGEQSQRFFGHGYATLAWPEQKFLDDLYNNIILMMRRMSIGRMISERGILDLSQAMTGYGVNIEVDPELLQGRTIQQVIETFPPEQLPAALMQILEFTIQGLHGKLPSLSPTFTGEAPFAGASGRAVNSLQWASFNQISHNVRAMNEFRVHRKRLRISLMQQFAKRPLKPHMWRRGVDFPNEFRDAARHVGYHLKMPDQTSVPNTPAGKMELVQLFGNLGYRMQLDELLKLGGFDTGYGWSEDTFTDVLSGGSPMPGGAGMNQNTGGA